MGKFNNAIKELSSDYVKYINCKSIKELHDKHKEIERREGMYYFVHNYAAMLIDLEDDLELKLKNKYVELDKVVHKHCSFTCYDNDKITKLKSGYIDNSVPIVLRDVRNKAMSSPLRKSFQKLYNCDKFYVATPSGPLKEVQHFLTQHGYKVVNISDLEISNEFKKEKVVREKKRLPNRTLIYDGKNSIIKEESLDFENGVCLNFKGDVFVFETDNITTTLTNYDLTCIKDILPLYLKKPFTVITVSRTNYSKFLYGHCTIDSLISSDSFKQWYGTKLMTYYYSKLPNLIKEVPVLKRNFKKEWQKTSEELNLSLSYGIFYNLHPSIKNEVNEVMLNLVKKYPLLKSYINDNARHFSNYNYYYNEKNEEQKEEIIKNIEDYIVMVDNFK